MPIYIVACTVGVAHVTGLRELSFFFLFLTVDLMLPVMVNKAIYKIAIIAVI